jgi:outer membrane protein assembly factor BamD
MRLADFTRIIILSGVCLIGVAACASNDSDPDDTPDISETPMDPSATQDKPVFRAEDRHHRELARSAVSMYRKGRRNMNREEWKEAIKDYDKLIAKFPFTDYATQAAVDRVYCLYKADEPDEAQSAADRFTREHPRHAEVDYVTYLRGLIDSSRDDTMYDLLPLDNSGRDVDYKRHAFEDFALLVQRFPKSPYVGDARLRMIALRNQIAAHDLAVARFYLKRGAYVAAARRAQEIVQAYPGAPGALDALAVLHTADEDLGLTDQSAQVDRLIAANQNLKPIPTVAFDGKGGGSVVDMSGPRMAPTPRAITDADVVAADSALPVKDNEPGFLARLAEKVGLWKPSESSPTTTTSSSDATPAATPSEPASTPAPASSSGSSLSPRSEATPLLKRTDTSSAAPFAGHQDMMVASSDTPPESASPAQSDGTWSSIKRALSLQPGGSAGSHASPSSHGIVDRSGSNTSAADRAQAEEKADAAQAASGTPPASSDAARTASGTPSSPDMSRVPHVHFLDRSSNSQGPASAPSPAAHGIAPRTPVVAADGNGSASTQSPTNHSDAQDSSGASGPTSQPSPATHGVAPRIAPKNPSESSN